MTTKQINFRIDTDLEAEIKEVAGQQGKKIGQWLQDLARWALANNITEFESDSTTNSNSDSKEASSNSDSSDHEPRINYLEKDIAEHETRINKVESSMPLLQEKSVEQSKSITKNANKIDELEWKIAQLEDQINSLMSSSASNSTHNSRNSTSNSKNDSIELSGKELAKWLKASERTIRHNKSKGNGHFRQWSQSKDPNNKAWEYSPDSKKFKPVEEVEDDPNDYIEDHKHADGEHLKSNGDKSLNEHLENAPSVEQLEKYPTQTPLNGSPKHDANHKA